MLLIKRLHPRLQEIRNVETLTSPRSQWVEGLYGIFCPDKMSRRLSTRAKALPPCIRGKLYSKQTFSVAEVRFCAVSTYTCNRKNTFVHRPGTSGYKRSSGRTRKSMGSATTKIQTGNDVSSIDIETFKFELQLAGWSIPSLKLSECKA